MSESLDPSSYRELLRGFLKEDLGDGDITTETVVPAGLRARGELIAKAPLVLAGLDPFLEVFRLLDPRRRRRSRAKTGRNSARRESGTGARPGARVAFRRTRGPELAPAALRCRHTHAPLCARGGGTGAQILDTRKTTPGLRALEKHAVRVGGGRNHRKDLAEAVLIKENHIRLAGGVSQALHAAQPAKDRAAWIEIEVTNFDELHEALEHGPDVILLDNMSPALVRQAVERVRRAEDSRRIRIEASGGITLGNVREFAEAGVDWISVGALTHSAPAVDLSFEIEPQ